MSRREAARKIAEDSPRPALEALAEKLAKPRKLGTHYSEERRRKAAALLLEMMRGRWGLRD